MNHIAIVLFAKEVRQRPRHHRADAGNGLQLLPSLLGIDGVKDRIERAISLGQIARRHLAHVANTQRVEKTIKANGAPRFNGF